MKGLTLSLSGTETTSDTRPFLGPTHQGRRLLAILSCCHAFLYKGGGLGGEPPPPNACVFDQWVEGAFLGYTIPRCSPTEAGEGEEEEERICAVMPSLSCLHFASPRRWRQSLNPPLLSSLQFLIRSATELPHPAGPCSQPFPWAHQVRGDRVLLPDLSAFAPHPRGGLCSCAVCSLPSWFPEAFGGRDQLPARQPLVSVAARDHPP